MKNIVKRISILTIFLSLFLPQSIFAFTNDEWLSIKSYENRKDFYVDQGEICTYLDQLYESLYQPTNVFSKKNPFTNIDLSSSPQILKAYTYGFIDPTSTKQFTPTSTVTKSDLATMLYKMAQTNGTMIDVSNEKQFFHFADIPLEETSDALVFAVSRGLIDVSRQGFVGANDVLTLEQSVDMMDRMKKAAPAYPIVLSSFDYKTDAVKSDKIAYLTFDDGISTNTVSILDTLDKYGIKATFFITGKGDASVIKRMEDSGHTIGNHTLTHNYSYIYSSSENFWKDILEEEKYLESIIGYAPKFIRFPGGSNNTISTHYNTGNLMNTLAKQAVDKGYIYFDWNVSALDATGVKATKSQIVNAVLNGAKNKKTIIVLMHQNTGKENTAAALPEIIEGLQKMDFELLPLSADSFRSQFLKVE